MEATQRKRGGKSYEPVYHSRQRVAIENRCRQEENSFWTFEPNGVRYADGHQTRPQVFVQWMLVEEEAPAYHDTEPFTATDLFTDADFEALLAEPAAPTNGDLIQTNQERLNITRIDHPAKRTFGELVRITRNGNTRSKFFSDRKYNGPAGALAAARVWRDAQLREVGHYVGVRHPSIYLTSENQTQYVGVSWHDGTRPRNTKYSLTKHGDKAFELAATRPMREEEWKRARGGEQNPPQQ